MIVMIGKRSREGEDMMMMMLMMTIRVSSSDGEESADGGDERV